MTISSALASAEDMRPTARGRRFPAIDAARGIALAAMAAYHMVWDLGFLRLTPENYAMTAPGKWAAHGIAGSFLVLVGVGLVLMNGAGFRPRPFGLRLARIGAAALLVTLATWFVDPQTFIFFGILHCIAVSSVLALPFVLWLPAWAASVVAVVVLALPQLVSGGVFDAPALAFLGLGARMPQTNDYVPLLPWFGLVLVGVGLGRVGLPAFARMRASAWRPRRRPMRLVTWVGRHSLAVYLVHQPVLMALLTGLVTVTGPHPRAGEAEFRALYERNCLATGGEASACAAASACVITAFRREGLWAQTPRAFTAEERGNAQGLSQACYEAAEGTAPAP